MSDHATTTTKTNIAWFKLAELVARKEREKALNVYRLLSHSFEDKAFALQVEGDILKAFDVRDAHEKYQQAAFLYKKEQRWVNAVGIYEHLFFHNPTNIEFLSALVDLYAKLDWPEKCSLKISLLCKELQKYQPEYEHLYKSIQQIVKTHEEKIWFTNTITLNRSIITEKIQAILF